MDEPVLFIGDVHGCNTELQALLALVADQKPRRIIFVGDLINKGPDSLGVLETFKALGARAVKGNHERAFLKYVRSGKTDEPNFETIKTQLGEHLETWVAEIDSWPYYIEEEHWVLVHAGLQPERHPSRSKPGILTKIRTWDGKGKSLWRVGDPPWYQLYKKKKTVIFGHWATLGIMNRKNAICLDTGCVYGGSLTGMLWPEREFLSIKAMCRYQRAKGKPEPAPELEVEVLPLEPESSSE